MICTRTPQTADSDQVSIAAMVGAWLTALEVMGRSLRLLLVEDHVDSAELLAELLQNHGHSVAIATSASARRELETQLVMDRLLREYLTPKSRWE